MPLYQMTPAELAEIRSKDATTAATYIDRGVLDPQEERERLAHDPEGVYSGIDTTIEIEPPGQEDDGGFGDDDSEDEDGPPEPEEQDA